MLYIAQDVCLLFLWAAATITATTLINYAFEILLRNWDNALDNTHVLHSAYVRCIFMETARAIIENISWLIIR